MTSMILKNARVAVGNDLVDESVIVISDGLIESVVRGGEAGASAIDCGGAIVLPGFIDVHIHGAMGVDVNSADTDGLLEVARFLARNGVTAWMPTFVPDSDENYRRGIDAIDRLMEVQTG